MSWRKSKARQYLWTRVTAEPAARTYRPRLSTVRRPYADPRIAHLLIVHLRIVDRDVEAEVLHRQAADRRQERVRGHHTVVLRRDQRHARIDQFLLRVQHVERRALTDARFFAHAIERDFGRIHLRGCGFDLRLGGIQLTPALYHCLPRLVAVDVEVEALLPDRLLGLTDRGIFGAALVDRKREHAEYRGGGLLQNIVGRTVIFRRARGEGKVRIERAFAHLHREFGDIDPIHGGEHRRALLLALTDRDGKHAGGKAIDRRTRRQPSRIDPDDAAIVGLRGHKGRLCAEQLGASGGE